MNLPNLEVQTAEQFAKLPNGEHSFAFRFPDGKLHRILLHILKARAKIRLAQFDIFHTDWAFRDTENPKRGSATLMVRSPRERFGADTREVADSLYSRLIPFDSTV